MYKVLIKISIVVSSSVEDSFDLSFVLLYLDHLEPTLEELILFDIIQNVLIQGLKFGNDLIINSFAFSNEIFSGNVAKLELNFGFCSEFFPLGKDLLDVLSLFKLVEKILKIG